MNRIGQTTFLLAVAALIAWFAFDGGDGAPGAARDAIGRVVVGRLGLAGC